MKKILMLLTAILPAAVIGILANAFLPQIFGESIKGVLPIIMLLFSIVTIGATAFVTIKKRKSERNNF